MKTLVVLVILAIVDYGSAIVCYECNSAINSMCAAAILPDSLKRNCSDHDRGVKHTLCRKIIQHVDHEINGHQIVSRVIRSCGWDETKYKIKNNWLHPFNQHYSYSDLAITGPGTAVARKFALAREIFVTTLSNLHPPIIYLALYLFFYTK